MCLTTASCVAGRTQLSTTTQCCTAHLWSLSWCMQAAVCSAEQQVSSLEAALQKGSQVTLSMTEKVAQTLAASNTQVDALKVGRS